ncbi:PucR family transcriptional regulator [Calidifontibacillus oryziterrae]|uniref:PucR family transcriptional regulator n=1 Tax=Calidifontibacillus oryziterrae TaxID=1191699 RepID=UPI0002D6F356|nr:PucR family transcriptional regulator [Calidifontibacillus oryziterrae]
MQVTVNDILTIEQFNNVEVIAGLSGLNRVVNNVFFMEVPDIYAFIDENGLLLTTLYPIADNEAAINNFIPRLIDRKIAGIAIKPGRYIDEIPELMIEQANEYNIPIILLPGDANLSLLTNTILELLLGIKTSILEFRDKVHQQLMELLLKGSDLQHLVQALAEIVNNPIVLLDNKNELIHSSINTKDAAFKVLPHKQNATKMNNFKIRLGEKMYEGDYIYIQPIYGNKEELFGQVVVLLNKKESLSDSIIAALEEASLLFGIVFQREKTIVQKERNYLDAFIRDIFNDQYNSQTEVIEKAKIYKWQFHFPVTLLNIQVNIDDVDKKRAISYEILESGLVERIVSEIMDISAENCKLIYYNDSLICFISVLFENRLKQRVKKAGERLITYFKQKGELSIGVSESVYNISKLKDAYEHSVLTYKIQKKILKGATFVKFYEDLSMYKLFYQIDDEAFLQRYVEEKIGNIIEYNNKKDSNLLETIDFLIKNNWNIQKTAQDMFIHYNTLRYRVNKLKELGINTEDGFELTDISVAIQLYQYLNTK